MPDSRSLRTIRDMPVQNKRVLVRVDFNVGMENGVIRSDARIRASLPTISWLQEQGCHLILCSHLGRPSEGEFDQRYSLAPVATRLQELTGTPVRLVRDYINEAPVPSADTITLLENVRFMKGESANDESLAKVYAGMCDVFVLDAFGSAHRAHASTEGVAHHAPAAAGFLVENEVNALRKGLDNPQRPVVAIIGGAKTSTKLPVLDSITKKADFLIPGGGIANNFIAAAGNGIGRSLCEPTLLDQTRALLGKSCQVLTPSDVLVAGAIDKDAPCRQCAVSQIGDDDIVVDIGDQTIEEYRRVIAQAKTVIWNGPVGIFEIEAFSHGTRAIAEAIAGQTAQGRLYSIAGGGDTLDAIDTFGIKDISCISTGGGAFLEFMENLSLVALEPLMN
ncbi:MAG: phosphoglycerate kinase [Gammaproteobacteria bacterium]|nr:phosphoglycerate kinase [Pseudomonadota bacterium]MCH9663528.1 phosphoglycerate kinase [Gammaproteobacteria bacterium]